MIGLGLGAELNAGSMSPRNACLKSLAGHKITPTIALVAFNRNGGMDASSLPHTAEIIQPTRVGLDASTRKQPDISLSYLDWN